MPPLPPRKALPVTWESHKSNWKNCTRCFLHETRKSVVLLKGTIPCEILVIGEAPGESEDVIGKPFMGPAGKVLHAIMEDALVEANDAAQATGYKPLRVAYTNVIACIPRTGEGGKAESPEPDCIFACQPRLTEVIRLTNPRMIVCVGSIPTKHTYNAVPDELQGKIDVCNIIHPAFILRSPLVNRGLQIQQATAIVRQTVYHNFLRPKGRV